MSLDGGAAVFERDIYANLLRDTRGMRREHASARDSWFAALRWDRKEADLFELEMLLKGLVCFGNPHNHPGSLRSQNVAHDYRQEMLIVRSVLDRIVVLIRRLLGERDKAYSFFRYLESVIPEDATRTQLLKDLLTQNTPEEALFLMRNAFTGYLELVDGMLRGDRITGRTFTAMHTAVTREVGRNVYFNPLVALEFRPEFDRIRNTQVLEILDGVESDAAHRVVALSFLALFRALRYVTLVEEYATEPAFVHKGYVILSVLRSDLRALTRYLGHGSAKTISEGFERELLSLPAGELTHLYNELARVGDVLVSVRDALQAVSNVLDIEVNRVFERELAPPYEENDAEEIAPQFVVVAAQLRSAIHHAMRTMCMHLDPEGEPLELVMDDNVRKASSERLRRDVWMFQQVLRAFIEKARDGSSSADRWASYSSFRFVREFLAHFRSIGYQLLRTSDYSRLDPFLHALDHLRDSDFTDEERLEQAVSECEAFQHYLHVLLEKISSRAELQDSPFDKKEAADTLKLYLELR